MGKVFAERVLYIKLGRGGMFETECIEHNGTIKLGYNDCDHELCMQGKWNELKETMREDSMDPGSLTRHIEQIRKFYEEPSSTMWITFHKNHLWYCFAEETVSINSDGTKERKTINGWKDFDEKGSPLEILGLNGNLTQVQRFQGTICNIQEQNYLLRRINCEQSEEQKYIESNLREIKLNLGKLIRKLNPKDFEIFVDLVFRNAGWSRVGQMGKTIKNVDIQLTSPVTNEKAVVQVKSKCNRAKIIEVMDTFHQLGLSYNRYFIVYHSPSRDVEAYLDANSTKEMLLEDNIQIFDAARLAELAVNSGLIDWLVSVAN
ncbi:MAG: hypothetical protein EOM45_09440 [Clostridia bacterium]|jgi:hypothetical protein|nr:hypothetical protein [Clostridia bacterium]